MKKLFLIFSLLAGTSACFAQSDSTKVKELIYNRMYKNIAAYYINYAVKVRSGLKHGFLDQDDKYYFFDRSLPERGWTLDMEITLLDWKYPVDGYRVYQIKLNGLRFSSDTSVWRIANKGVSQVEQSPSNYNLICVNEMGSIKFISGRFFIHDVSEDFKLNNNNPESYLEYLKYKTFEDQVGQITFLKRKGKKLIFSGYSDLYQYKVRLTVDPKNPGRVDILILNGK
ncbi:MAG: hypothetical protein ABI203_12100 [Mucilaginibacter sp.]